MICSLLVTSPTIQETLGLPTVTGGRLEESWRELKQLQGINSNEKIIVIGSRISSSKYTHQ